MEKLNKRISVIGLGYIGLPTSIVLANTGHKVIGVDNNLNVINKCKNGELHIVEPGLEAFFKKALDSKNLEFSTNITESDIYIICVPTPFMISSQGERKPDLSYIKNVANSISKVVRDNDCIILESTSPVGTTQRIQEIILENTNKKLHFAYCPERVLPGNIMQEIVENDRIVGGLDSKSTEKAVELYKTFVSGNIFKTDSKTAELSKLIENSYRDVNIAFANEISIYSEKKGIDTYEVIKLANKHPRVNIMSPGVGVGGHCIAVDPWFLVSDDSENTKLIRTAREINDSKTLWAFKKIKEKLDGIIKPKVAIFGLAYKPDIDDLRESPSMRLAKILSKDYEVFGVEPNVSSNDEVELISIDKAFTDCDFAVICVPHKEFLSDEFLLKLNSKPHLAFCELK